YHTMQHSQPTIQTSDRLRSSMRPCVDGPFVQIAEAAGFAEIVNVPIRQAAERRTQHSQKCDVIMGMVQHAKDVDEVDDFLAAIVVLLPFDEEGNIIASKGVKIPVGLRQFSKQECHLTCGNTGPSQQVLVQ